MNTEKERDHINVSVSTYIVDDASTPPYTVAIGLPHRFLQHIYHNKYIILGAPLGRQWGIDSEDEQDGSPQQVRAAEYGTYDDALKDIAGALTFITVAYCSEIGQEESKDIPLTISLYVITDNTEKAHKDIQAVIGNLRYFVEKTLGLINKTEAKQ